MVTNIVFDVQSTSFLHSYVENTSIFSDSFWTYCRVHVVLTHHDVGHSTQVQDDPVDTQVRISRIVMKKKI